MDAWMDTGQGIALLMQFGSQNVTGLYFQHTGVAHSVTRHQPPQTPDSSRAQQALGYRLSTSGA